MRMNMPTKLTVLRLILSAVVILLLCFPFYMIGGFKFPTYVINGDVSISLDYILAAIIFVIASVTDFLDGYYARKNNEVTNTGKMLDAIADKVLVNSVLIIIAAYGYIHVIVPVIIVLRDIVVNAIKMEAAGKGKVVAAIKSGKFKTACLMTGIFFELINDLPFVLLNIKIADFLLYVACVLSIISAIQYFTMNKAIIFDSEKE